MVSWNAYIMVLILPTIIVGMAEGQLYNNTMTILRDKLGKDVYDTQVRPLKDQSKVIVVSIYFYLVSLVEVNDVTQSFICNGFLSMDWTDEMVAWDPRDYGDEDLIHPLPQDIWRPKIVLLNTIGARDLFGDDDAPLFVFSSGQIRYAPGALFPTSCELDLVKFPFDTQTCVIELAAMNQMVDEMIFGLASNPEVDIHTFIPHVEWNLASTYIEIVNRTNTPIIYSAIRIHFVLKRRPAFLLLNIILPVVFLSFLSILVFIIPAQSGEKVGFGITVLLALAVFLSFVSTMLPRSSRSLPRVTIYLFILLVISLLTVVDSIIIVYLHYLEKKAKKHYRKAVKKLNLSSENSINKCYDVPESGNDRSLQLNARLSTDQLNARLSTDQLNARLSTDQLNARLSTDQLNARLSADQLNARLSADQLNARLSADQLNARLSAGQLNARLSTDQLNARLSADQLNARLSTDLLCSRLSTDQLNARLSAGQLNARLSAVHDKQAVEQMYAREDHLEVNKFKAIGKYIDRVSLIVFMVIWTCVTIGFMLDLTSSL